MTEEEKLIREVAAAICRANGGCPLSEGKKITAMTSGTGSVEYNDKEWEDYIPQATSAISAMKDFEYMANLVCPPANEI